MTDESVADNNMANNSMADNKSNNIEKHKAELRKAGFYVDHITDEHFDDYMSALADALDDDYSTPEAQEDMLRLEQEYLRSKNDCQSS
ncbi:MAG: hypothetical protein K6G50_07865 [bacterium]|nr:hypothetical protein [bacterium]